MNRSVAPAIIHSKKHWDKPEQRLKIIEHQGRPIRKLAASWVDDLVNCKKMVLLCRAKCARKFKPETVNYQLLMQNGGIAESVATCDDCKTYYASCNAYVPKMRI